MKHIILFNGPPGSGKDTSAEIAWKYIEHDMGKNARVLNFKDKLYEESFKFFCEEGCYILSDGKSRYLFPSFEQWVMKCTSRSSKDAKIICVPIHMHNDLVMSPREFLIYFSEEIAKPLHGQSVWADATLQEVVEDEDNAVFLIPDAGFDIELDVFVDLVSEHEKEYDLVLMQMVRDGCSFDGDSRKYLPMHKCDSITIENNGTKRSLAQKIESLCDLVVE